MISITEELQKVAKFTLTTLGALTGFSLMARMAWTKPLAGRFAGTMVEGVAAAVAFVTPFIAAMWVYYWVYFGRKKHGFQHGDADDE